MVFPDADYDRESFGYSDGQYTFTHQAFGADKLRYSTNFGMNWTDWRAWEATTTIPPSEFQDKANFWEGEHLMVQCMSATVCQFRIANHMN